MALVIVEAEMNNKQGHKELYIALKEFPGMPIQSPRLQTRDELAAWFDKLAEVARYGELVEYER